MHQVFFFVAAGTFLRTPGGPPFLMAEERLILRLKTRGKGVTDVTDGKLRYADRPRAAISY